MRALFQLDFPLRQTGSIVRLRPYVPKYMPPTCVLDFPLCLEILSSTSSSLHPYLLFLGEGEKLYVLIPQRKNGAGALDMSWKGFDGNTPQIADK